MGVHLAKYRRDRIMSRAAVHKENLCALRADLEAAVGDWRPLMGPFGVPWAPLSE